MSSSATTTSLAVALVAVLSTSAFAQRPNQAEDDSAALVEEGRADLRAGKLDAAAKALDQAISLNPRRVEAYVVRAGVYAARKQYKDGIELMRKAQALAPLDLDVLTSLGSLLVLSGDDSGVPLLEQVVSKEPARFNAQLLLGHHWHEVGRWPDAITALEAYFAHRPDQLKREDASHRIDLADAYLRFHKPQKALELFESAGRDRRNDLRVRIGIAWATAATDCRRARPLLADLEPIADSHPEVWLVDGQCALSLGDVNSALALGRRYLERAPNGSAAGHALVGEAQASRGDFADARRELEAAHDAEKNRRRWVVRLAYVIRRSSQPADAVAKLDEIGPPNAPSIDPDWWVELGESMLAMGDSQAVVSRLGPIVPELPGNATVRIVLGAAQLAIGQADAAIKSLDEAEAIQASPRSKKVLVEALTVAASAKLAANDAAAAELLLVRADQLDATPAVLRDLGIARLMLGKASEAVPVLDRAVKLDTSPITAMLDARAHATSGDVIGARPIYERALAAEKDNAAEVALDWAASELAGGDPQLAVNALEKTAHPSKLGPLASRHRAALADARHAAALAALRQGNGGRAVELLRAATNGGDASLSTRCDLALAEVVAGDAGGAINALKAITGQSCPFPPPLDTQAAPILVAFTEGLNPKRAGKALERLTQLGGKSSGVAANLLGTAIRVVALNAAQDAYRSGALPQADKYLATARGAAARIGSDEIAQNIAVLDLAENRVDNAIGQLERLAGKVPEALVNLGIAYERKGDQAKALDAWKRAKKAGVRFPPLNDWIESKERIYGGTP